MESLDRSWEIYFVDDHSRDGSFELIREYNLRDRRVGGCRLVENRGQQNALFCGLLSCRGEIAVTMDDDGQHPLSRLPQLLETLEAGWDVVYMVNRDGCRNSILRLGTYLTDRFFSLFCGKPAGVEIGSYRILRRSVIENFRNQGRKFIYVSALIFRTLPPPAVCSIRYNPREAAVPAPETSRFSLLKRAGVFLLLFLYYGPFRRLILQRAEPYRVEETL